jgi:hypothetical protein
MVLQSQLPPPTFKRALIVVGGLLAAMWAVQLLNWLGGRWLELDHFATCACHPPAGSGLLFEQPAGGLVFGGDIEANIVFNSIESPTGPSLITH